MEKMKRNEIDFDPLPPASPDQSMFGIDLKININTIDQYLGRGDVAYRDVRMLFDPADFCSIGGKSELSSTITGFRIVPYPYLATLSELPVPNAYTGDTLYTLTWDSEGGIASAVPNYIESRMILEDLFPQDKAIFLMCGIGGYANMTRALLLYLGRDPERIYNIGGNWSYTGENGIDLVEYAKDTDGITKYATWRADYAIIDFSRLHKV